MGKRGFAEIRPRLIRRVRNKVAPRARVVVISPNVMQVQPVPNLVRRRAPQVEGKRQSNPICKRGLFSGEVVG